MLNLHRPKFEIAAEFVIKREGGYVNDPKDKGGETNFGISKRRYPNVDIANLTLADALAIYRRDYWDIYNLDKYSLPFSVAAFDSYVQHRPQVVQKMLDEAKEDWKRLITARRDFYGRIVANDPSQAKFLKGWTIRLNHLSKFCGEIEQSLWWQTDGNSC